MSLLLSNPNADNALTARLAARSAAASQPATFWKPGTVADGVALIGSDATIAAART